MTWRKEFWQLLKLEFFLDLRKGYTLGGIFLFVCSSVFIIYKTFNDFNGNAWNGLFWLLMLFTATNAVAKSFVQETGNRKLYYYQLGHPLAVIFSKVTYNALLLGMLSFLIWGGFSLVAGNPVKVPIKFIQLLAMGSISLSLAFSFVSAISSKAEGNATLVAILSFPVIIPILLLLLKRSAESLRLMTDTASQLDLWLLLALDLLLVGLLMLLFPLLWKD